jgi:hypothetical protein
MAEYWDMHPMQECQTGIRILCMVVKRDKRPTCWQAAAHPPTAPASSTSESVSSSATSASAFGKPPLQSVCLSVCETALSGISTAPGVGSLPPHRKITMNGRTDRQRNRQTRLPTPGLKRHSQKPTRLQKKGLPIPE